MISRSKVSAVLAVAIVFCMSCYADEREGSGPTDKEVASLQAQMLSHGKALTSGTFRGTGHYFIRKKTGALADESKSEFTFTFDANDGFIRIDTVERGSRPKVSVQYIETPDHRIVYSPETKFVSLKPPLKVSADRNRIYFDVRNMGLALGDNELHRPFAEFRGVWENIPIETTVKPSEDPATKTILRISHKNLVFTEFTLDSNQGMTPVAVRQRWKTKDGNLSPVMRTSNITWQKKDGVMVPKTAKFESSLGEGSLKVRTFDFDWISVNKEVDSSLFEFDSLKLVEGTQIVDEWSGKPVLLQGIKSPPKKD